jgi:hypothetical protein
MMTRPALLVAILMLGACSRSPLAPIASQPAAALPPPPVLPTPAGTRVFASPAAVSPSSPLSRTTLGSSYLLYDDGTFALVMPGIAHRGTYTQLTEGSLALDFSERFGEARGRLLDRQLIVTYDMDSAFEDAVYTLIDSSPSGQRR